MDNDSGLITITIVDPTNILTLSQVAQERNVTYSAVRQAVKKNRLKHVIKGRKVYVRRSHMKEYEKSLYRREHSKFEGQLRFDNSLGNYSVKQTAKKLHLSTNYIYYLLRRGRVSAEKKGGNWVIHESAFNRLAQ